MGWVWFLPLWPISWHGYWKYSLLHRSRNKRRSYICLLLHARLPVSICMLHMYVQRNLVKLNNLVFIPEIRIERIIFWMYFQVEKLGASGSIFASEGEGRSWNISDIKRLSWSWKDWITIRRRVGRHWCQNLTWIQ